ncbi:MAG: Ig-like domain-containing protein [Acidobacteria bacterium]|nr:Ig-like domain-containing protein [Acidobacteriota bacterium]
MKPRMLAPFVATACLFLALACSSGREQAPSTRAPVPGASLQVRTEPADGALTVARDATLHLKFSEQLRPDTLTRATVALRDAAGNAVEGNLNLCGSKVTFTPAHLLQANSSYILSLSGAIASEGGANLQPQTIHFLTSESLDPKPIMAATGTGKNYRMTDSSMPGGPAFAWEEIVGTGGTPIWSGLNLDDSNTAIALPFPVLVYGTGYTTAYYGSNGYLTFGGGDSTWSNYSFPTGGLPRIAPYFDDLYFLAGSTEGAWTVRGSAPNRRVIFEWKNIRRCCYSATAVSFQTIIYENGNILFQYLTTNNGDSWGNGAGATVGLNKGDGTTSWLYSYNTASLADGKAILFTWVSYDTSCLDDQNRSRICFNSQTGDWKWEILSGPGAGTFYTGTASVRTFLSTTFLTNPPGSPTNLSFNYDSAAHTGRGTFFPTPMVMSSLVDSNTLNNPPSPCMKVGAGTGASPD